MNLKNLFIGVLLALLVITCSADDTTATTTPDTGATDTEKAPKLQSDVKMELFVDCEDGPDGRCLSYEFNALLLDAGHVTISGGDILPPTSLIRPNDLSQSYASMYTFTGEQEEGVNVFMSDTIYLSQEDGASSVIIMQRPGEDLSQLVIPSADKEKTSHEWYHDIRIPSIMVSYEDGNRLLEEYSNNLNPTIVAQVTDDFTPPEHAAVLLFVDAIASQRHTTEYDNLLDDVDGLLTLAKQGHIDVIVSNVFEYCPVKDLPSNEESLDVTVETFYNNKYCTVYDEEELNNIWIWSNSWNNSVQVDEQAILSENLRQACIAEYLLFESRPEDMLTYLKLYHDNCSLRSEIDCSRETMVTMNINYEEVESCMCPTHDCEVTESGDAFHSIIERGIQWAKTLDVVTTPTVAIYDLKGTRHRSLKGIATAETTLAFVCHMFHNKPESNTPEVCLPFMHANRPIDTSDWPHGNPENGEDVHNDDPTTNPTGDDAPEITYDDYYYNNYGHDVFIYGDDSTTTTTTDDEENDTGPVIITPHTNDDQSFELPDNEDDSKVYVYDVDDDLLEEYAEDKFNYENYDDPGADPFISSNPGDSYQTSRGDSVNAANIPEDNEETFVDVNNISNQDEPGQNFLWYIIGIVGSCCLVVLIYGGYTLLIRKRRSNTLVGSSSPSGGTSDQDNIFTVTPSCSGDTGAKSSKKNTDQEMKNAAFEDKEIELSPSKIKKGKAKDFQKF